jgi:hypothetical protein
LRQLPSQAERSEVCQFIAESPPAERIGNYLVRTGRFDANNDGVYEQVAAGSAMGTMGGDAFKVGSDGEDEMEWSTVGHEGKDYFGFGEAWLLYAGRTYLVHFRSEDGYFLSHLGYLSPENLEFVLCDFSNSARASAWARGGPEYKRICDPSAGATLSEPVLVTALPESSAQTLRVDRQWTAPFGTVEVDFDNDGGVDRLVALRYDSDAGRGCEVDYFDVLDASGTAIDSGARHELLMRLQSLQLEQRDPAPTCNGNEPSWLVADGKTYFRNKYPGEEPRQFRQLFDDTYLVEANEIRKICETSFVVSATVRRVYDPYKRWTDPPD